MNSSLPSIQKRKHQSEQKTQYQGSTQRKIELKIVTLIVKVQRKPADPEWQLRAQQQNGAKRQEDSAHYQQDAA